MKGVSEVIAIILILMITIAIAGLAYTFMSSTMASTTSAASAAVDTTTTGMLSSFTIESFDDNIVYIRNVGQTALSDIKVYVNDMPVRFVASPLTIGSGGVGAVAISDYVRTGDTVKISSPSGFSVSRIAPNQCYGAMACWRFDEGEGRTAKDSTALGADASLYNGTVFVDGVMGTALKFNSSNQSFASVSDSLIGDFTNEFSLALWFKVDSSVSNLKRLVDHAYDQQFALTGTDGENKLKLRTAGNSYSLVSNTPLTVGSWYHVVVTFSDQEDVAKMYINGTLDSSVVSLQHLLPTSQTFYMGRYTSSGDYYFNGTMDEIMVWDRVLTLEEVSRIYHKMEY